MSNKLTQAQLTSLATKTVGQLKPGELEDVVATMGTVPRTLGGSPDHDRSSQRSMADIFGVTLGYHGDEVVLSADSPTTVVSSIVDARVYSSSLVYTFFVDGAEMWDPVWIISQFPTVEDALARTNGVLYDEGQQQPGVPPYVYDVGAPTVDDGPIYALIVLDGQAGHVSHMRVITDAS